MSLWSKLLRWSFSEKESAVRAPSEADPPHSQNTIELPKEPFVFECQSCGKVFEARRKRPLCPECDSPDVSLMSE